MKGIGQWLSDSAAVNSGSTGTLFSGNGAGPADNITLSAQCGSSNMGVALDNNSDDAAAVWTTVPMSSDSEQPVTETAIPIGAATPEVGVVSQSASDIVTFHVITADGATSFTVWYYAASGVCHFYGEVLIGL
jgi:hypothetical protein